MARRVVEVLEDDLTGTPADETVVFALDGVSYEIDLTADNATAMRETLAPYVSAARKAARVPTAAARRGRGKAGASSVDSATIREWARAQGISINERGRVPASVVAAYDAAH